MPPLLNINNYYIGGVDVQCSIHFNCNDHDDQSYAHNLTSPYPNFPSFVMWPSLPLVVIRFLSIYGTPPHWVMATNDLVFHHTPRPV